MTVRASDFVRYTAAVSFVRVVAVVCLALVASSCAGVDEAPVEVSRGDITLVPDSELIPGRVPARSTLAAMLRGAEVAAAEATQIVEAAHSVFDLRKLHAGQAWRIERTNDHRIRLFEYEIDPSTCLRIVPRPAAGYDASIAHYDVRTERTVVSGGIDQHTPSLFGAMAALGETPELPIALADIFGGELDFNSELQPGDQFQLVVEKLYRDHRLVKYGPILAATFTASGRTLVGLRYTPSGGDPGYYDLAGRSLKRFFLRSPLKFDPQITSGFSAARMHPVLHEMRAHLGVDYRAPVGAPVIAVANGVVSKAGWSGGSGRMVGIRHAGGYESFYLHLSAINVRAGAHVSQGTIIGRVGQSGLATGPHLDYRLKKNGLWVNPVLEHRRMPPGAPIPDAELAEYLAGRAAALEGLTMPEMPLPARETSVPPALAAR
jgi:murein DD-endopeptidase MepM/ murein hydrolase activator NlpD